jgi:hypothetical protein
MGITRARIALACVVAAVSLALIVTPSAMAAATTIKQERAQNTAISKANTAIKNLKKTAGKLGADIKHAQSQVDVLVALSDALPPILTALGDGETALKNGLLAVQAALQDPTTGLVGLNNARPIIGAALCSSGTCAVAPGSEFTIKRGGAGTYVLSTVRLGLPVDVSQRVVEITGIVGSKGEGTGFFQAVNCLASATATATCKSILSVDPSGADVLVTTQADTGSSVVSADRDFQVAMIAG